MDATSGPIKYNRSSDITLKLKRKSGTPSSTMLDNRLFTGGNNLHAVMDTQTCLWHFRYESGLLPEDLRCQFTSYRKAIAAAADYFKNRNVEIEDVIDNVATA